RALPHALFISPSLLTGPATSQPSTLSLHDALPISHYEVAVKAGDFSPGASVRLVREPDNQHDPNAIAVNAADGTGPAGYVNKQNVARLTKRLNRSEQLDAIAIRGAPSGQDGVPIMVLVTDLGTLEVFSPVARVRDCARSRSTAPMSEHS